MERNIQVHFDEHEAKEFGGGDADDDEMEEDRNELRRDGSINRPKKPTRSNRNNPHNKSRRDEPRNKPRRDGSINRPKKTEEKRSESNNPYNNKGKRKRDQTIEAKPKTTRRGNEIKSKPKSPERAKQHNTGQRPVNGAKPHTKPKRDSKYSNTKKGSQGKINEMFSKVYGEKNKDKGRKVNRRRSATK
jgi:hypothetical protein